MQLIDGFEATHNSDLANGYLIQGWQELISSTENAAI
jgi:hypothetical protein